MFAQRTALRLAQRSAPVRSATPRRFNSSQSIPSWIVDNEFNRERAAVKHHAASTSDLWRKLSIFAVVPCLIGGGLNAYNLWNEHWEHWEHMPPLEERVEYPYQNIRAKNFPWGNGDKLERQRQLSQQGQGYLSYSKQLYILFTLLPLYTISDYSSPMARPDVLIVGAGPSGLVTALWLVKQGISVRIVDKAQTDESTSRALAIHARTLELYRQLDLAEEIISEGHRIKATNIWTEGSHKGRLDIENFGFGLTMYPFIHILSQSQHEKLLEDSLNSLGVQVERDLELISYTENDSSITGQLKTKDGRIEDCEATFLAGCDGAHSVVRHASGIGYEGATYSHIFFVADIEASGPAINGEAHVTFNQSEFMLLFPYDNTRRARISGAIDDTTAGKGIDVTFEDVSPQMERTLKLQIDKVNWFSTYRSHHRVAAAFRKGRAFLVGDAAHIHSPVGGQGMNTGIGDAINLAWKLSAVIKGQAALSLLDSYDIERRAFANQLVNSTDRGFNTVISQNYFERFMRTTVLPYLAPFVTKIDFVRRNIFRKASQIMIDYRHSPLSTGAAGYVHGGDRVPWAPVGDVDNFDSLSSITWQVHVYGEHKQDMIEWCQSRNIPLHTFPWDSQYGAVGLEAGAAYLIRPDTYIAVAEPSGHSDIFDQYLKDIELRVSQ
ncbi:FAD binding domain-containing protein [Aspergillus karnatakaensis]|uniref:cytochrome c oxidase subunit VIa n=1 Tax=Aspergillus karnatakaensis TaxID=1810916 RepID=UPI003CCE1ECA